MNFEIINQSTTPELLSSIRRLRNKKFRLGAGCTDLLLDLKRNPAEDLTVINISQVRDTQFTDIKQSSSGFRLGACVTADKIVTDEKIKKYFPVLYGSALNLASTQIRQVASVGGNLCTASPSGDIACALMALKAECEIMNANGRKRIITIRDFFTGPRMTVLKENEFLYGIILPINLRDAKRIFSGFIKIGTRKSMECSVVSLAYHIQTKDSGEIILAGISIGASAPTIRFAENACSLLLGKNMFKISEEEKKQFAEKVLGYASPISDIRATAWYRKEVLFNISKSIFERTTDNEN
ncbi:MAG: FAD binding domain-containing protein [Crocinitomicaceae bacterium]|nr:FAD binding domain-containing protein [Crocinitomicaceae bacterium]